MKACTSGASRVGSARHHCRTRSRVDAAPLAARARWRAGVGNHRGARSGRGAFDRSTYSSAIRSGSAMASACSSRSSPSTERPSARSVSAAAFGVEVDLGPSPQLSTTVCAAWAMCPANSRTWCLVNIGCRARRRGNHSWCGRINWDRLVGAFLLHARPSAMLPAAAQDVSDPLR